MTELEHWVAYFYNRKLRSMFSVELQVLYKRAVVVGTDGSGLITKFDVFCQSSRFKIKQLGKRIKIA